MKIALFLAAALLASGCKRKETFPTLGDTVTSPVDVALSDSGDHFFVLNSDFDRTYNVGSLLVVDKDGTKVKAVEVPRMGRSLTVAGNDLLVTVDYQDDDKLKPRALLFDVSDVANPTLKADFELDCSPINAAMRKNYKHFAVSCSNGALFIGTLGDDRTQSTLKKVRNYGVSRRALYLDADRELLLGFPTALGKQATPDEVLFDATGYSDDQQVLVEDPNHQPNEVPDKMEQNRRAQSNRGQRQIFQFFVYDLKSEIAGPDCVQSDTEDCRFPYREVDDQIPRKEMRWIYFNLYNFDGAPDQSENYRDPQFKFYRTNFYEAKADPDDANVFYLSHRGEPDTSQFANQIVKVTINGDLRDMTKKTSDVMSYERVYGFKGAESSKYAYPGAFQVSHIGGQKLVVVNNFRDLVNWVRGDAADSFWLGAQSLDGAGGIPWFAQLTGSLSPKNDIRTYYQVAVNDQGRGLSCSFYGNRLIMFDLVPDVGFNIVKPIE